MNFVSLTLIFGGLAAGILGWLHHQLKPFVLPPVVNYIIGSATCLIAFSGAVIWEYEDWRIVVMAWGVWAMAGLMVSAAYFFDGMADNRRNREIREKIER